MPTKKQYQTRLAPDTADSVDEYADRHDVTAAEAVRRLIRAGLDVEQDDTLDPDEIRADLDEIRADLRELREAIEDEAEDEAENKADLISRLINRDATRAPNVLGEYPALLGPALGFIAGLLVAVIGAGITGF